MRTQNLNKIHQKVLKSNQALTDGQVDRQTDKQTIRGENKIPYHNHVVGYKSTYHQIYYTHMPALQESPSSQC